MSTTARRPQGQPRGRTPRVLLAAGASVAVAVALATLLGGVLQGSDGALGALVGGSIALCFFLFGSLVVGAATRMAPQAALAVALTTYTLQVALLALVFVALGSSDAVGTTLSAGWLAGGVVAATVAWTVGQLVASSRARVPVYDIDLPGPSGSSSQAGDQPSSRSTEAGAP
jgi:ATP synthase protein I